MIEWQELDPEPPEIRPLDWDAFCQARMLPDERPPAGRLVCMAAAALDAARGHGDSSLQSEVGGILCGRIYAGASGTVVDVRAALPAQDADGTPVHLKFTARAWDQVFALRAELADDDEIVGWYHTHPGLGVFLSSTDLATQRAFFPHPWHVAMVIDPVHGELGAFMGAGDPVAILPYLQRASDLEIAATAPPIAAPAMAVLTSAVPAGGTPGAGPPHEAGEPAGVSARFRAPALGRKSGFWAVAGSFAVAALILLGMNALARARRQRQSASIGETS